jgi:hypothetical protein
MTVTNSHDSMFPSFTAYLSIGIKDERQYLSRSDYSARELITTADVEPPDATCNDCVQRCSSKFPIPSQWQAFCRSTECRNECDVEPPNNNGPILGCKCLHWNGAVCLLWNDQRCEIGM